MSTIVYSTKGQYFPENDGSTSNAENKTSSRAATEAKQVTTTTSIYILDHSHPFPI